MNKSKVEKCPRCGSKHFFVDRENGDWQAKCGDCKKKWDYQQSHFNGEMMSCALCGKQEQHVVGSDTNWRVIELERREYYICVDHFPPDGSNSKAFEEAYTKILANLTSRQD